MKKVVGYIRVSTDKQDLKRQLEQINEYVRNNSYELVRTIEEKKSGAKGVEERKGYNELLSLSSSDCDIIVMSELSRFSREEDKLTVANNMQSIINRDILVHIINTNKTYDSNFCKSLIDIITFIIESDAAAKERTRIKERMVSGKKSKALAGAHSKCVSPFGYKSVDKLLVINEEEAEIIREIFDKYINGWSTVELSNYLYSQYPQRKWHPTNVLKYLKSELYKGIYTANFSDATISKYYEHLRIVSDEVFNAAQSRIEEVKKKERGTQRTFNATALLRNLLKCSDCGGVYSVHSGKAHNYRCYSTISKSTHSNNIKCEHNTYISQSRIESIIWDAVSAVALLQEHSKESTSKVNDAQLKINELSTKRDVYNSELESTIKARTKYRDMASRYDYSFGDIGVKEKEFKSKIESINNAIAKLDNEIKNLTDSIKYMSDVNNNLYSELFKLYNNDMGKRKELLESYLKVIYVHAVNSCTMLRVVFKDLREVYLFIKKQKGRQYKYEYQMINDSNYTFDTDMDTILYKGEHNTTIEDAYQHIKDKSYYMHVVGIDKDNANDWVTDEEKLEVPTDNIMSMFVK